jgi:hypothetical protein
LSTIAFGIFGVARSFPTSMADDKEILAARDEMRQSILAFRERANSDRTFVTFKTLVGYDSVFPPTWDSEEFDIHGVDEYRTKAVADLVGQVTQATVEEWFRTVTNDCQFGKPTIQVHFTLSRDLLNN